MGNKLPRNLEEKMKVVGEQIKLAQLRRNLSLIVVPLGWTGFSPC